MVLVPIQLLDWTMQRRKWLQKNIGIFLSGYPLTRTAPGLEEFFFQDQFRVRVRGRVLEQDEDEHDDDDCGLR